MSESIALFNSLLQLAIENDASDIHIKSGKVGCLRLHGQLQPVEMDEFKPNDIYDFVEAVCPEQFIKRWQEEAQVDFSYKAESLGRFRVNAFHQRGTPSIVFRYVKDTPPSFEDLNHEPETMTELCSLKDGIILLCGATGSGKSSTLASMLNWINYNLSKHIVTLEDPIEFNYYDEKSIFNQREVGIDTPSFAMGMKSVLRQDPDIILIGEMRDADTFKTAISAADTGHLVFGTLHSANAQQAIQRLFEFFPPDQQENMRRQIAGAVKATITQKLVPALHGGRVPAVEILAVDSLAKKIIEEGEFEKIPAVIEASKDAGSKTFNQDLYRLIKTGIVTKQEGLAFSPNAKALEMNLKGIFLNDGGLVR